MHPTTHGLQRCLLTGAVMLLAVGACSKPGATDAGVTAPVKAAPTEADLFAADLRELSVVASLPDQLRDEAARRPSRTPTLEVVAARMAGAGFKMPPPRQFLGRTVLAKYCAGGLTEGGLGVSVCEYGSAEKAERGRAYSLKAFASNPNRTLVVNKSSVLTLVAPTAAAQVQGAAVKALFEKLDGSEVAPAPVAAPDAN